MKHLMTRLLACVFVFAISATSAKDSATLKPAIDFTLKSNKGNNVKLSDLKGQVVMINFWASWCAPCRQEMPKLEEIYKNVRHKKNGDPAFTLLGVNIDEKMASAEKVLKKTPVTFPILFDSKNTVVEKYQVQAMPTSVLIDCDGNVSYVHKGYKKGEEKVYEEKIRGLIAKCS